MYEQNAGLLETVLKVRLTRADPYTMRNNAMMRSVGVQQRAELLGVARSARAARARKPSGRSGQGVYE
jgi:hypothetical protein